MNIIKPASSQEMVAAFLQAELHSPRFRPEVVAALKKHDISQSIIENPDLKNTAENSKRDLVLAEYRGWQADQGIFESWPLATSWHWAELTIRDVQDLQYIDYSYWNELSDDTHLVKTGAKNVAAGKIVFNVGHDRFWEVAKAIDEGTQLPPLILLKKPDGEYQLVEGHLRATAYCLATSPPDTIRAIIAIPL